MFANGSHIQVRRGAYTHHGIYIGSGFVIHYAGKSQGVFSGSGLVRVIGLKEFSGEGKPIAYARRNLVKGRAYPADVVVQRASSRLAENKYDVFSENCEHFCNWCTHDDKFSHQVDWLESGKREVKNMGKEEPSRLHKAVIYSSGPLGFSSFFLAKKIYKKFFTD